jgi:uncharacterized protein YndB with AHSA1/START domain
MKLDTSVHIRRPIEDVFAYLSDPANFSDWNSAVRTVRTTSETTAEAGSTYAMERELPSGRAENELEIATLQRPREFTIRTTSGPTSFRYRYRLTSQSGETIVTLDAEVALEGAIAFAAPLARRAVKRGVDDNFAELKKILEGGLRWR